jgi:hypothetical protein
MDPYLERLKETVASAVQGMSQEDLARHAEGKWSVAEILEHLYLSYTGTTKGFQRCLEAGKPLATSSSLKQRVAVFYVLNCESLPSGRKAPKNTQPRGLPLDKIVADVGQQIVAMDEAITKSEEHYGKRTKLVDHPILGPLTARQWCKFHWIHGWHHVKQILKMREPG